MNKLPRINPQKPISFNEIAIVGEAPGKDEVEQGIPFVGKSGKLLNEMLSMADINREHCYITNVFLSRPPDNKVGYFFTTAKKALKDTTERDLPKYNGMFLKKEFMSELLRLTDELLELKPKLVISLGATPMWAFTGLEKGITKERGNFYSSSLIENLQVLLTFHPAYVLRNQRERDTVIGDFKKAKSFLNNREF